MFEVQSKGSIDSLVLNLKKAQSNAAVQAVVAVADEEQLAKIIRESAGVIDEKSLRTWDSEDVLAEALMQYTMLETAMTIKLIDPTRDEVKAVADYNMKVK